MIQESVKALLQTEAEAVQNIPVTPEFEKALNILWEQVHQKKGKLITSGMGKAGQIAINMATTFSSTGTPAVFLHPSEAQHGDLGVIQENDTMILISNSGKTREIIELVELARGLRPDIRFIVITGNPDSLLAQAAEATLFTGNPPEVCALGLTPTTSTTTMTVIGDVLVVLLMKKIGFTNHDYSLRHHGGYLGDKSREAAGREKK
jgi:arabinose-5-phosphate isomerase